MSQGTEPTIEPCVRSRERPQRRQNGAARSPDEGLCGLWKVERVNAEPTCYLLAVEFLLVPSSLRKESSLFT